MKSDTAVVMRHTFPYLHHHIKPMSLLSSFCGKCSIVFISTSKLFCNFSRVLHIKVMISKLPKSFEIFFQRCGEIHTIPTRLNMSSCLYMPRVKSVTYGLNSITSNCIHSWNKFTQFLESPSTLPLTYIKNKMFNYYIDNY